MSILTNKNLRLWPLVLLPLMLSAKAEEITDLDTEITDLQQTEIVELQSSLQDSWSAFLQNNGWGSENQNDGVIAVEDRDIIISSGIAYTEIEQGQPGWVESRISAYERAELDAKQKIVRYLSESLESERGTAMLENASWTNGIQHEVQQVKSAQEKLKDIGNKALDLTSEKLSQMLLELDPEFDLSQYQQASPEDLKVLYERTFNRKVASMATRMTVGISPLYNAEGFDNDQYAVLVGVIWSPNLNRIAMSLFNQEYNIPQKDGGQPVDNYIPKEAGQLISTFGTRIILDENGEYAILSYAQAQPRPSSKGREAIALNDAKSISTERARGLISNFVREGITVQSSETMDEISREYSDFSDSASIVRNFQESIRSSNTNVNIKGLSTVKQWSSEHPLTGQKVVGTVMLWSPSKVESSEKMNETMVDAMSNNADNTENREDNTADSADSNTLMESLEVNTSAY